MTRFLGRFILVFIPVFVLATAANAQIQAPVTALQLQNLCTSKYDIDVGLCAGYVMAVAERLNAESDPGNRVCLSPSIAPQTLVVNVQKAWESAPPAPQDFAAESVEIALRQRFHCP